MDRLIRALRGERCRRLTWRRVMAVWLGSLATLFAILQGGPLSAQAISPCQTASAPAAAFSVTCTSLSCTFNVTSSPPANPMFGWDFGDLTTALGPSTSMPHAYPAAGSYMVTLTVTDANGAVGTVSALVGVSSPGTPLAADDFFETDQDTPITISIAELLANDAPGVSFVGIAPADVSKCYVAPGASDCTYTPNGGYYGTDKFGYSVQDALGNTGSATVWITIRRALVANPDYFNAPSGGSVPISTSQLLANDTPGALFVSAQDPLNGTLSLASAGPPAVYSFAVAAGFVGDASFDYLISADGNPPYALGVVTVTVVDSPPTANFQVSCVNMTCTVHPTSFDPDGTIPTRWLWNWGDGTPTIEPTTPYRWADQTHTYAASGYYIITHTVYDVAGLSGSLQLQVLPNTPPIAANVIASTQRDVPVTIDVLATASDPDGDPLTIPYVNLTTPGASWQVVQLPSGRWGIKVTPPDTFVGTMTFTFTACDPWGGCAAPATVTLTVQQWQVIVDALGDQFFCYQNSSISIPLATLLANDYDQKGNTLTVVGCDKSILMGTLDCTTNPAVCTFTPNMNESGRTIFRYTVRDAVNGLEDTATVTIYVGSHDQAPTVSNDFFTTTWGTPMIFTIQDLFQNAVDADGDILTVILNSGPTAYGSLNCSTPMYTCTYTPNPGFAGTDSFTFTASDMVNPPVTAVITVLTLPLSAPTFDAREAVVLGPVNQSIFIGYGVLANDYAPSGGPIVVTGLDTTNIKGSLSCGSSGCTYTPPFLFQGVTSFKYTASDSHGATDTAIVRIVVGGTEPAPVASPQALSTPKNAAALRFSIFDLMHNSYHPGNNPLTVLVYASSAKLGSLSCTNPNYWCTYTPNADTTGADAITYLLTDGYASVQSTLTITITP